MFCKGERDQTAASAAAWMCGGGGALGLVCVRYREYRLEAHNVRGVHGPALEELRGRTLLR